MPTKPTPEPSGDLETVWVIYEGARPPPGVAYIDGTAELVPDDAPWLKDHDVSEIIVPDDFE